MRNLAITVMSILLTTVVISNAYYQKKQFYPSVVYITKSNPSMAIIYIQAFVIVIIMGKLMRKIFFGELRAVEVEHLMERSWYAITETCLAFTVFRDDFNPKFLALFTLLLFLKAFHWLADERVDYMERSPVISWLFHIRIVALLTMLGVLDVLFVCHAYQSTLNKGASVQLVFGFEYAILLTIVLNIVIKYAFHVNDFHELPWENKAVFLLYTELIMGFIKVILYFSFVIIMVRIYTLPLFAFRPMYYTVRAFKKAVNDVVMSRRAIRNMNTLYPDASAEELSAMDNVCIICREEMRSAAKKLPCNHIFHTSCLRSWFQRQQTCPTCRLNILRTPSNGVGQGAGAGVGAGAGGAPVAGEGVAAGIAAGVGGAGDGQAGAAVGGGQQAGVGQQPRRDRTAQTNGTPAASGSGQLPRFRDRTAQTNGAVGGAGSSSTTASDEATPSNPPPGFTFPPPLAFNLPESMPLIPPFPFMAFNVPPPMPPTEGLSDEELRRLEQNTREGLEHRIRCLYMIQSMLDTSVLMMQQYCAAVATAASNNYQEFPRKEPSSVIQNASTSDPSSADTTKTPSPTMEVGSSTANCTEVVEENATNINSEELTNEESTFRSNFSEEEPLISDPSVPTVSDRNNDLESQSTNLSTEQEMLRQRRLKKFTKTN